ncbi:MAG: mycothiol system anti-sigma-R factor [Cyclobacteriaceae bacterium]|nr:mycothiol system anti-sigma-R factor [Cyclobacteriaceae bacterium]MBX2956105.1 mycothiol system anti-sigma-R factor [Cyclobacteriaceae bacterium]
MPDSTTSPEGKKLSCIEMLQLMLEGDATLEQQQNFKAHLDECMPCYKSYNLEVTLKMLIKSKCNGNGAPPELVEKIKTQISQNMPH